MINELKLELKDVGPIVNADIDINRINIIGGQNSTGKSTASKLLYCFLKINSSDREKLVARRLRKLLYDINVYFRFERFDGEGVDELNYNLRKMRMILRNQDYDDFDEIIDLFYIIEPLFNEVMENYKYFIISTGEIQRPSRGDRLIDDFNKIKRILNSLEGDPADFYKEVMKDLLYLEMDMKDIDNKKYNNPAYELNYAKLTDSSNFSFEIKLNEPGKEFESEGKFNIRNVFYLESFSIFDTLLMPRDSLLHYYDLQTHLFPKKPISRSFDDDFIKKLEEDVDEIVGGRIVKDKINGMHFSSNDSTYTSSIKNTASGIKQIAVIQTLLHNRFLGDDCVLIMDEPEVNLHPEWQIKLAEILVLLAKEGNITIYINSHSPMFIEAMDTYTEIYDFEEYVNFYLSKKLEEDETKATFEKIPTDELYKIYDNLGDPYDYLDEVRLNKGIKKEDKGLDF